MPKHILILIAAVTAALILPAAAAKAATLRLDAMSLSPANRSDFSIEFDDLDGDGLFSLDELLSFSGLTTSFGGGRFFDGIRGFADIPGFADGGDTFLRFTGPNFLGTTIHPSQWDYSLFELDAQPPTAIPLPAAAWLFASALIGLGLLRRRRAGNARPHAA